MDLKFINIDRKTEEQDSFVFLSAGCYKNDLLKCNIS